MKLIDLSQPVYDGCPNCPDHPPVTSRCVMTHATGGWQLEMLTLANHTGSHVDAPLHKIAGAASLDEIPLERWVGDAYVVDLRDATPQEQISSERIAARLPAGALLDDRIVLLATGWGDRRAKTDEWLHRGAVLSAQGARWLVAQGIRGVGIDWYAIGGEQCHEALLGAGVWIVEELRFSPAAFEAPRPSRFWCLPINLKGHTGAFCRPVLEC